MFKNIRNFNFLFDNFKDKVLIPISGALLLSISSL